MRHGERFVGLALLAHALRPVVHGQVRPVVVAFFQLGPGVFEHLLPWLVAEQWPKRRSADLNAIVVAGLIGRCELEQGVAQLDQLQLEGLQGFELLLIVTRAGRSLVAQRRHVSANLFELGLDEVIDRRVERLAGKTRVIDPHRV